MAGGGAAWRELAVDSAKQQLAMQSASLSAGGIEAMPALGPDETDLPPRAQLARALYRAIAVKSGRSSDPADELARARREIDVALAVRPRWGEAWLTESFLASVERDRAAALGDGRTELLHRRMLTALARSYVDAPYLEGGAQWRVQISLANWQSLDNSTRSRAINEAVWSGTLRGDLLSQYFRQANETGAYAELATSWRAWRLANQSQRAGRQTFPAAAR